MMCINGDEGEVGTFKDKYYLDRDPHRFLEGAIIAAHMVEAEKCYIYMRDEYPGIINVLKKEIAYLVKEGLVDIGFLEVRSWGLYMWRRISIDRSVEGKRVPRHRPPYVAQDGVFGFPTLVHNVETVFGLEKFMKNQNGSYHMVEIMKRSKIIFCFRIC